MLNTKSKFAAILSAILLLGSAAAFAQQSLNPQHMQCLGSVSNYELLTETNRRMSNGNNGGGWVDNGQQQNLLIVSCNSYQLVINTTNMQTGQSNDQTFTLGTSSQCNELAAKINSIKNQPLYSNKIVGVCNSYQLQKFLIDTSMTVKQLPTTTYGTSSQCQVAADQLNGN